MKWKSIALMLFVLVIPFVFRVRLVAYLLEEALVVLFVVAAGMMVSFSVLIVFILVSDGTRAGLRRLKSKSPGTGGLPDRRTIRGNTVESPARPDDLSKHGVAGSKIHEHESSA